MRERRKGRLFPGLLEGKTREEEEEEIRMLNIRMPRTPIEGSPVPGCLTPGRAHILMWLRFVPGTTVTKCLHPNRGHRVTGPIGGFPAGQESAARAAACRISGGMRICSIKQSNTPLSEPGPGEGFLSGTRFTLCVQEFTPGTRPVRRLRATGALGPSLARRCMTFSLFKVGSVET